MSGKWHVCAFGRYCQNLHYTQQLQRPLLPGHYQNFECVLPIGSCLLILFGEAICYFLLALYLDNVLPDDNGVHKTFWCDASHADNDLCVLSQQIMPADIISTTQRRLEAHGCE